MHGKKQLKINLFAVCNVFFSLYAGSLCLSYCFTTSLAAGIVEIQCTLVAVIFYGLLCESCIGRQQEERLSVRQFQWKHLPFSFQFFSFSRRRYLTTFPIVYCALKVFFASQRVKGDATISSHYQVKG